MGTTALQVLILAALYGFLAALLYFLWQDERRAARVTAGPPPAHLVLLGADPPSTFALSSSTLLGRAADNPVCLEDPLVSAHHARISFAGGQWLLEDLGSRNGTQLNAMVVESPVALAAGDVIRLGGRELRFSVGPAPDLPRGWANAPADN